MKKQFENNQSSAQEKLIVHWVNKLIPIFKDCQTINSVVEKKIIIALKEFEDKKYSFSRAELLYRALHELKERNSYLLPKLEEAFISSAEELISQKIADEWDSANDGDFYELLRKYSRQLSRGFKIDGQQIKSRVTEIRNK